MDDTALFLGGAFGVQGHEAFDDFGVGERDRPAVGGEHGGVQFVVQLFEHGHEALVMDEFFLGGQPGRAAVLRSPVTGYSKK